MANNDLLDLMTKKLESLKRELVLATDASVKFKLKEDINELKKEIEELEKTQQIATHNTTSNIMPNENTIPEKTSINIFVCYSSKDRDLREELVTGLKSHLCNYSDYEYRFWVDKDILIGDDWDSKIQESIKYCNVGLLLVDAMFASSEYIKASELPKLLDKTLIVPVLLRAFNIEQFEKISKLQFFKPTYQDYDVKEFSKRDRLFPFDELIECENPNRRLLNKYCDNLAQHIHTAVSHKFPK